MKRLILIVTLLALTVSTSGCRHGRWRMRGAKCRPGMSMPAYTQPPAQAPPNASCNPGYPPPGYMQSSGYVPTGPGYAPSNYMSSPGYVTGDTGISSGNVGVQEFPTVPMDTQTQIIQRPIMTSPVVDSINNGSMMTVPGPESGPMPNG